MWRTTTPEAAIAARRAGCARVLRSVLGDRVETRAFARATELLLRAGTSAPADGRPMYAALLSLAVPDDLPARLFHAASLLREHRGDGHLAALLGERIGRLECHVLYALSRDMPAHRFGRLHHLPRSQVDAVVGGMRERGLVTDDGSLSEEGRAVHRRVEDLLVAAQTYG